MARARVVVAVVSASFLWTSARGARAGEGEGDSPAPDAAPAPEHDDTPAPPAHDDTSADASPNTDEAHEAVRGVTGFEIGARIGYAVPLGQTVGAGTQTIAGTTVQGMGRDLSDVFSGGLPLTLDAGYRVLPSLYIGAFFSYSFLFIKDSLSSEVGCNAGPSCSAHQIDLGADFHFHLKPNEFVDPWIGLGFGYEWTTVDVSESGQSGSDGFSGFQFVNFQLGLDFKPDPRGAIGPCVSFSLGQYDSISESAQGQSVSSDFQNKALHEWLTFGIRGAYDFAM